MNCPECDRQIESYPCRCGYAHSLTPVRPIPTKLYQSLPFGCAKEEFGLTLYETIMTIGGILGLDEQRALAVNKHEGYKVQSLMRRRHALQEHLAVLLPLLSESEMAQILLRYRWVTAA